MQATLTENSGMRWDGDSRTVGIGLEARTKPTRMRTTISNTNTRDLLTATSKSCAVFLIGPTVRLRTTPDSALMLKAML